jgi:(2R)-ethylmalonyl-CoA mutase
MIAVAARHAGFDVVYGGIRLSPEEIATSAIEEGADVVGLSILSGSHVELAGQVIDALRAGGAGDVAVVVGGIIPAGDVEALRRAGVADVFGPTDFRLEPVMARILALVERRA